MNKENASALHIVFQKFESGSKLRNAVYMERQINRNSNI